MHSLPSLHLALGDPRLCQRGRLQSCYTGVMIERTANPRKQGDAGMGIAISWFARNGYTVCIPLTDSQKYDLVVEHHERHEGVQRVQVKTTTQCKLKNGIYQVDLRTQGGNRSGAGKVTVLSERDADLLFIVSPLKCYLVPTSIIQGRRSISLGEKVEQYSC